MALPVVKGYVPGQFPGSTAAPFPVNPDHASRVGDPVAPGDWMVCVVQSGVNYTSSNKPIPSAGWTELLPFQNPVTAGTTSIGVWAKLRQAGEGTYDWTQDFAPGNALKYTLLWGSGSAPVAEWVAGPFGHRSQNATTTTAKAPSITVPGADTLVLALAGERSIATETPAQVTVNNGFTRWFFVNAEASLDVATKEVDSGATGDTTFTYPNTHTYNGIAAHIGITAAPADAPTGLAVKVAQNGSLVDARLKVSDGADLLDVGALRRVEPGYPSVTAMLAEDVFWMAHRGGSRDFPEMSRHAYGQAALYGYGMLEISLARTSDGVWFGLHDESIDRTSGVVTGKTAAQMTWAEVQQYSILGNTAINNQTQPARPYMLLAELIVLYGQTHVLMVDPKYATVSQRTELLNMLDAEVGATERFVMKGFHTAASWAQAALARGYQTWGYYYEADVPQLPTTQGNWTILGMEYIAPQASWDAVKAYGKPVIGHICRNTADVDMALAKGADGIQVSGILNVAPRL